MAIAKDTDKVWIQICYFVEFQKNGEGMWTRKYVDDEEYMTVISVGKSISYDELYKKVIEKLKINSMLYELEMRCEIYIPSKYPELPMKIDCDESVEWLVAFSDRTMLNITLKKKVIGIEETYVVQSGTSVDSLEESQNVVIDDDGRDVCGIGGESLELNRPEENDNVAIDDYNGDIYCLGEKSTRGDIAAVDPLLPSFGECVVLHVWKPNNINDDILDIDRDDFSDDGNFGEDARENTPIGNTLGGNSNGSNSHKDPIMKSIPSHPRHVSSVRIPEDLDICEAELFVSKDHLIQKLEMMALKAHFEFKATTSTRIIYVAECAVKQCGWRVRAVKVHTEDPGSLSSANMSEFFRVRIYEGNHSCSPSVRQKDHKHASYTFIGRHYLHKFRDVNCIYRAKDIISDFHQEFGYTIKKGRANKAKRFALQLIHGNATESHVVDLVEMKCSCKVFDLDKFPGAHAITAAKEKGNTGYDYCTLYDTSAYWRQSYSEAVCPLRTAQVYDFPDKVLGKKVHAPLVEKYQSGRPPSKKRKLSAGERRGKKCGRCK